MIVGLALGVVPSVWPELIRPHPYMVAALFVIGVLMMAAPLFSKDAVDTPQVGSMITVGGDNNAPQIISHGNVYLGHTSTSLPVRENKELQNVTADVVKPVLRLKLIPHGDNDSSAYLEVVNQGDAINISAQLRIVGSSTRRPFKTYPFNGQWKSDLTTVDHYNERTESYVSNVRIETNRSRLLKIASIVSMMGLGEQEMAVDGIDDESVKWDSTPRQSQELPYFIIQVTLIAKGYSETVDATYKVGPTTSHGPFQMTEVTV